MPSLDPTTLGLALLAFVVALYALVARDQKTPYITTSVYLSAILVLIAVPLSVAAKLLQAKSVSWSGDVDLAAWIFILLAIVHVLLNIIGARNRRLHFRDDNPLKHEGAVRWIKRTWRNFRRPSQYHNDPLEFDADLLECIHKALPQLQANSADVPTTGSLKKSTVSVAYRVQALDDADQFLIKLVTCFLARNFFVQYATCTRHPSDFLHKLKTAMNSTSIQWAATKGHIVAVDAYTPHFGFADSVHASATKQMKDDGIEWVTARASYASLHSAAARAFNIIKKKAKKAGIDIRQPALVIYDGPYALVDLESVEQYRVFIRHVLPSERLWGGMMTIVVEFCIADQDFALLRGYADVSSDSTVADTPGIARGL